MKKIISLFIFSSFLSQAQPTVTQNFDATLFIPYTGAAKDVTLTTRSILFAPSVTNNGYIEWNRTAPNSVTAPAAGLRLSGGSGALMWTLSGDGFTRLFVGAITGHRSYTTPNASGTLALTSDIIPAWNLSGNSITTNTNFIGTSTNTSFNLKTNNVQSLKLDSLNNLIVYNKMIVNRNASFSNSGNDVFAVYQTDSTSQAFEIGKTTGGVFVNIGDIFGEGQTTNILVTDSIHQINLNGNVFSPNINVSGAATISGNAVSTTTLNHAVLATSINTITTLDFPSTPAGAVSQLTVSIIGAVDGDATTLGVPNTSMPATGTYQCYVSAADVITVRYANNSLTTAQNPNSGSFTIKLFKN